MQYTPIMHKVQTKALSISPGKDNAPLTKEQKAFNNLIRQIDAKRASLAALQEIIPAYQKKFVSEFVPLVKTSQELQIELVHRLDRASEQKGLTSAERRKIHEMVSELAGGLVAELGDAEMKEIYNKHSGSDYDAEAAAAKQDIKSMLEEVTGVDLGDDLDLDSSEEIFERVQAQKLEQQAQFEASRLAQEERQAKRKKTAKQIAREEKQLAEEQQTSQSIRELYRKLASALHPDREPDPQERDRKTELMQRINHAYAQNNLLLLLELQLELEHIDQTTINNITASRLKHYNKILNEQLKELKLEIFDAEDMFKAQYGISPFAKLTHKSIMHNLAADIAGIRQFIHELKDNLLVFQDTKMLKAWLKAMQRRHRMDEF